MALCKYEQQVISHSDDKAFDATHQPGAEAPHPGIYRCTNCGDEIAIAGGNTLPPQNHRQHAANKGSILWQLVVYPVSQP